MQTNINPVITAIQAAGGTQQELARKLGVTRQAVCQWQAKGEIPLARASDVVKATKLPFRAFLSKRQQKLVLETN